MLKWTPGASHTCCVCGALLARRSTLEGAAKEFGEVREARGEIVLLVEGADAAAATAGGAAGSGAGGATGGGGGEGGGAPAVERVLRELLAAGTPVSSAVKEVSSRVGSKPRLRTLVTCRFGPQHWCLDSSITVLIPTLAVLRAPLARLPPNHWGPRAMTSAHRPAHAGGREPGSQQEGRVRTGAPAERRGAAA